VPAAKAQFIGKLHGSQMDLKIESQAQTGASAAIRGG